LTEKYSQIFIFKFFIYSFSYHGHQVSLGPSYNGMGSIVLGTEISVISGVKMTNSWSVWGDALQSILAFGFLLVL